MVYASAKEYISTCASLTAKIAAIDAIILALLDQMAAMAENDGIDEYWLNDGQVQIKASYKGGAAIEKSIESFERLKARYGNLKQGSVVRLRDSNNFPRNGATYF